LDNPYKYIIHKFNYWSKQNSFYHFIFWVMLFLLQVINYRDIEFFLRLAIPFINVSFYALIAYFNFNLLFPKYIKDGRIWLHFVVLLIASIVITPIKTIILFFITSSDINQQALVLNTQLYTFLSLFLVGVSSTIYRITTEWLRQQNQRKELESQNLQSELKFLKSQINPHFLFNTLNSLYALTLKKSDLAPAIVLKLSEMMRYMLYECNEKQVPLSKEINYMNNYLEMEKLRHGSKMKIDVNLKGDIQNQKIAPLLLMPFIENAFKHGINNQVNQGYIKLDIQVFPQSLKMNLENSKSPSLPFAIISDKKSGGIGLVNVKRRLEILYPTTYELEIKETDEIYKVALNLNLTDN